MTLHSIQLQSTERTFEDFTVMIIYITTISWKGEKKN